MIYLLYLLLAAIVVFLSIRISHYVDLIDKTTDISGAFIGGVMLAAVTSLPELFTSISSVAFIKKPELVIGNILGSNLFNLTILGIILIFMFKRFDTATISKSHITTIISIIVLYALLFIPMFFGKDPQIFTISVISLVIVAVYIFCIKKMSNDTNEQNDDDKEVHTNLTTKQLFTRFILLSVVLVAASISITYVTDLVAIKLNLGVTLAGALLLGIATSLPEVTSCFALAKIGNFNATIGNILGSNLFNLFILVIADILLISGSIFVPNTQSKNLVLFGFISSAVIACIIIAKKNADKISRGIRIGVNIVGGCICILSYVLFLFL